MMPLRNTRSHSILILGASARAAAFSALAGGLTPICADQFADADLLARCPVTAVRPYPDGLEDFARQAPDGPWMYTGALENHAAVVARIAARRALLGNGPDVLGRIRDPFAVHRTLTAANLAVPEARPSAAGLPRDGTWLRKSLRSSGGQGIELWVDTGPAARSSRPGHYFQRYVAGTSCAAIYLASQGAARLLGVTAQILNRSSRNDATFRYAGSVGPLDLGQRTLSVLVNIGTALAREIGLVGLFGVDFIDDGQTIWPVEVNPRYTASIEILERGLSFSAVGWHVAACRDGVIHDAPLAPGRLCHGKRILYARHKVAVAAPMVREALAKNLSALAVDIADIPRAGTRIKAGHPIMTIFARANSPAETLAELDRAALAWDQRLYNPRPADR